MCIRHFKGFCEGWGSRSGGLPLGNYCASIMDQLRVYLVAILALPIWKEGSCRRFQKILEPQGSLWNLLLLLHVAYHWSNMISKEDLQQRQLDDFWWKGSILKTWAVTWGEGRIVRQQKCLKQDVEEEKQDQRLNSHEEKEWTSSLGDVAMDLFQLSWADSRAWCCL